MNLFQRSLIAAGVLTLLGGAGYVNKPLFSGKSTSAPGAEETTRLASNPDFFESIAMEADAGIAATSKAPTPSLSASPQSAGDAPATSGAGKPLFLGDAALTARSAAVVEAIVNQPDTFDVRAMKVDAGVVSPDTHQIELDLGPRRVNLVQERTEGNPDGSLTWIGHVKETAKARPHIGKETPHDALNSAILVSRGGGITGSVRMDGQLFRIRPIPDGGHAVIEVDESRRPPDHPDSVIRAHLNAQRGTTAADAASGTAPSASGTAAAADAGPVATIRVMVVATDEAIAAYAGDMRALVDLAIAESNQGYTNSGIDIRMELAGYYTTNYVESGDWNTELDRFRKTADGFLDGFHATRDAIGADVNVLIINDTSSCGLGYVNASAAYAFSVVHYGCATGYYSFAHEIGHNQGAEHDPATSNNLNFAYGHGYRAPDNSWRTVMAYNCTPSCPRVNYWSNPNVTYGGVAMGNANQSDNHRVLNETRAKVAAFRPDPVAAVAPVANFSYSANGLIVAFTDSSTDSDGVIAARSWNFGDGSAASTATNPSHAYAAAGTYNVSLTATDDDGATHTVTKAVTVHDTLTNGLAKTGISGAQGSSRIWTLVVPAGASNLKFVTSGGTGDADLYVKFGSAPTTTSNDCMSERTTNAESCSIPVAQAGTYYVMVRGYSAFSGLSLMGVYGTGASAQVYRNATAYAIPDGGTISSPIAVADRRGNASSTAAVSVDIVHPFRGDLKIELVAPDGSVYLLKATNNNDGADNVKTTYTVDLSSEAMNGTWKLRVGDYYQDDAGTLNSWSITP